MIVITVVKSISNGIDDTWAKILCLSVHGNRKLGKLLFSLRMRKENLHRTVSRRETEMVTEVFLSQKATAWGGFTWEF